MNGLDRIEVLGIRARGRYGAEPGERDSPQELHIDVAIEIDFSRARRSDLIADTLDYAAVHARVVELVADRSYALLERLGDEIGGALLEDERVAAVSVTLSKPERLHGATPRVIVRSVRGVQR